MKVVVRSTAGIQGGEFEVELAVTVLQFKKPIADLKNMEEWHQHLFLSQLALRDKPIKEQLAQVEKIRRTFKHDMS